MKKQFDFLQEASPIRKFLNLLGQPVNLFELPSFFLWKYRFPTKTLFLLGALFCQLHLVIGQVDAKLSSPNTSAVDICAGVPIQVEATPMSISSPLVWREKNNNGRFSDSLNHTNFYTPNPVTGTSRVDELIVTLDQGYAASWQNVIGIDTTSGQFKCTIAGQGSSGARSVNTLSANTDGWVEAKLTTAVQATFGLSATNPDNDPGTIDYGIRISIGEDKAFIIENDTIPIGFIPIPLVAGDDIFRVERVGNTIIYKHNRIVFHTSTIVSSSALFVDVSMNNIGETLEIDVSFGNNSHVFSADTIKVQVLKAVSLDIGMDKEICEGDSTTVSFALSPNAAFDQWTFIGGTFSTTTRTFTPNTPLSVLTRIDTVIAFSTPASNSVCPAVADTVLVTVRQAPTITMVTNPTLAICEEDSILLKATPGRSADTIFWTTNNGMFNIANGITNTTLDSIKFEPAEGLSAAGAVPVYLKADSDFSVCSAALDTISVDVHLRGEVANDFSAAFICQTDSIQLAAVLSRGATALKWEIKSGMGTLTSSNITNPYYNPYGVIDSVRHDTLLIETIPSGTPTCEVFVDTVVISVFELDSISNAFPAFEICEGDSVKMDVTLFKSANALRWIIKNGIGFFLNSQRTDAIYIPSKITTNDDFRNDTLLVMTIPGNSCLPAIDTVVVTIHKVPELTLSQDTTICISEMASLRAISPRGMVDNITKWEKLNNGVLAALTDQQPNDTSLYKYNTTIPIVFPALSRKDTLVATTGMPTVSEITDVSSGQTCIVAIDTVVITVIDTANITILIAPNPLCELETTEIKAKINTGATVITWKFWPNQVGNGTFASVDSVTTKYTPNDIAGILLSSRIDTLMAISVGLTGCQPDTAYAFIDVRNAPELAPIADTTICDGKTVVLETEKLDPGEFDTWTVQPAGNGTFNNVSAFPKVTYNPVDFATTIDEPRVDTIFFITKDTSAYCPAYKDSLLVTINPQHQVSINDSYGMNASNLDTIAICEGSSTLAINAKHGGGTTTVKWTTVGNSGSFNNATTLKPKYTPNIGQTTDIRYDTLIISSSNTVTACTTIARDSIIVQVQRAAALTTVPDTVVCRSGTIQLSALSTGIGDSLFWNILSGGEFQNSQTNDTTITAANKVIYKPTVDVIGQFRVDTIVYTTANPAGVCPAIEDEILISVYNAPTIEIADPTKENDTLYVCEGVGLSLDGAYGGGAVGATWSILSNAGVISGINNDTLATYTPNPGVTNTTRVDTIILAPTIIAGTCSNPIVSDTLYVIVQQGPVVTALEDSLTMCEGTSIDLAGTFGSVATGFTWSTKVAGNGNIDVLTNTTATYTPTGTITGSSRLDVVYLTSSSGTATCLTAVDSIEIFVSAKPVLELGTDVSMCGNLSQVLTPQSIGVSNLLTWTSTDGSFAINPSPTGLYQPDFTVPTFSRSDGIIVTSIDSLEVCPVMKDTMLVTVYGLARVAIGATGIVCEDDSLTLNAAFAGRLSDFTYTVSNDAGIVAVNNNQLLYIPDENTTQSNRVDEIIINLGDVDGAGTCPSLIDTVDITVLNTPRAELINDITICVGEELDLLLESFGLIDTFKSSLSTSLVNYPSLPINFSGTALRDTVLYGTSLIDGACPAVSNQVIVTIQAPGMIATNIPDTTICIANTLGLTTALSNPNGYNFVWKVAENNGTFDDANKATPIYTPNAVTTTSRIDIIMVEIVDATNICNIGFDTLLVTVVPSATLTDFRDTTICEGETLNISATVNGTATFFWSSNSGTVADSSATQTAYTHARVNGGNGLDIITGHLVFENDACVAVQKNIKVTVIGESTVSAGLDTAICTRSTLQLSGTMGFGIDSVEWLVLNTTGTFDNNKSLTAIYTPNINSGTTDRVDVVILSTTATLTCIKPLDTLYVTVKPTPTVSLGADQVQMGTPDLILNAVTSIPVVVGQWSANNGVFNNSTLNQTVYSANALPEGATRLDTIIYKGDFDIAGCTILKDTLVITFEAPPMINSDAEFCQALCLDTAFVNIDRFTNRAVILANNIDPFDTCGVSTDLTMKLWYPALGTPEPLNVTDFPGLRDSVVYTCANKGYQNLNVYVAADSMDVRVCPAVIKVEDAFITCGERIISGKITTFKGEAVAGFQVFIEIIGEVGGVVPAPVLTDADGRYEFTLPSSRMYRITPKNNENLSKGVTAFDNVIISRHILGLEFFDSPFKTIAADVNKSGTVTAFDIVEIRKIVLDRAGAFSNNTSWRFVDASFLFENIMDAAAAPFEESFIVNETMGNTFDMDFIAIKVGDVNGSNFSNLNGETIADDRNDAASIAFEVTNMTVKKGEIYEVPFQLLNAEKVAGYQFTVGFDGLKLLEIQPGVATPAHFGTSLKERGLLTTCWSTANPVNDEKEWFTLQFQATKEGRLSELLIINSAITPMEAYTTADENIGVQLTFVQPIATTFDLFQNKPNPFKNETVIGFALPTATKAKITILDMQGKIINRVEGDYESGYNEIIMDMTALPRGVFYYRLETAFGTKVQKMMHIE